ncbi:TolB family protein [Carboxylicivirga marina]|uniref:TolB family protein n=1 Tax=Carboxylicivirga marina TaxID=2800988 RepID=UPI0025984535|nr:hypothetical protein [uncultured Carboxylicivirga sp.]
MMKQIYLSIILSSFIFTLQAQYYSSGADPANIKWQQVNSDVFKVVYPEEIEAEAKRFIAMLDSLYEYGGHTLAHTPKPIKVIMHAHSAYSNGFVSWAPKRMEIYPTPHQDMFAQDWLEQLAIHEFRHVVQIDKLNKGFTKILTIPFGQQAIGAVLGLYAPLWFLEGDAVLTETTLSESGRGRRPSIEQEIRAQVIEKQIYHYDKAYFGSYKDYVPNHYNMGYLLTAGARHSFGSNVWERALDEAARKPWSITPFNRGIKQVTGKNKVPLYNEVFKDCHQRWLDTNDSLSLTKQSNITQRDTRYKNYRYPTAIDDTHIIAEVNGVGELNHFVKINTKTKEEEKILITGSRAREPFSYADNKIVWTELEQHPRWENQIFSVIRLFDLTTGKQKKLSYNSRYKAPAISSDGKTIAVTHTSLSNQHSIHLLNVNDGTLIKEIAIPDNAYPLSPSWDLNGEAVTMVLLTKAGKQIVTLSPKTDEWSEITKPDCIEIRFPKFIDEHIYFAGSYSGIENIYRVNINGNNLEKVTESQFGAAYTTLSDNQLIYQNYTSDGYMLVSKEMRNIQTMPWKIKPLPIEPYINKLQEDEKGLPNLKDVSTKGYQAKKYSKWNLFNFHSWAPAFVNVNEATITPGASIMSQNLLGTTFITAGYNADQQYSREKFNLKLSYQAWWPVFDLELKAGNETIEGSYTNETNWYENVIDAKPNHYLVDFKMKLPLNYSRGKYIRSIQPSAGISYQKSEDFNYERNYFKLDENGIPIKENEEYVIDYSETITYEGIDIKSTNYSFFAYNLLRSTQRDVASRWGQVLELSYRNTPFGGWDYGSILGIHSRLYFPGIGRHHAIRIDNDWHFKEKGEIHKSGETYNHHLIFSDYVRFPRGVNGIVNDDLYSFKGDYMMPLLSPDFNIPGLVYLKRITTNLFYDFSQATQRLQYTETKDWITNKYNFSSLGTEIRGELHPFRFVFPISLGYRYAYLPESKEHYHEVLFSMGLSGIIVGNK